MCQVKILIVASVFVLSLLSFILTTGKAEQELAGILAILSGLYLTSFAFSKAKQLSLDDEVEDEPVDLNELRAKKAFAMMLSRICDIRVLNPLEDIEATRLFSVSKTNSGNEFVCYSCFCGAYNGAEDPVAHALVLLYSTWAEVNMVWTLPAEDGDDDVWLSGQTFRFEMIDEFDGEITEDEVVQELEEKG